MKNDTDLEWLTRQIVDLQSQLAFQEDTLHALNDVVTRQQQQIENLHELCNAQKNQLVSLSDEIAGAEPDERPPHY